MDKYKRHQTIWKSLFPVVRTYINSKFNICNEQLDVDGPCLIIPNHVTSWDPLLVALSLRKKQAYFVASEHIFRLGFISRLLVWMVEPIARRKATMGTDTVKACLRHLKDGHSVVIFAEGDASWAGESGPVFPATGKLARSSGASLVTLRIEGAYLSLPRWGKGIRKGRVYAHPVNVYTPEQLKAMTPAEINDAINRDIYENAWERQKTEQIRYKGKKLAEGIETALYICPHCHKIGGLKGRGNKIECTCGFSREYTETGLFREAEPFENIAQWDKWQLQKLTALDFEYGEVLFSDTDMTLTKISTDHSELELCKGSIVQYKDRLVCGDYSFELSEISNMAMVQANRLLFLYKDEYYEIFSEKTACLRKYLAYKDPEHI